MIETRKDLEGRICAFIEWQLVDQNGKHNNHGAYVWINDLFVAPQYQRNGNIRTLSLMIKKKVPWATHYYFTREKYKRRMKVHRIDKYLKGE